MYLFPFPQYLNVKCLCFYHLNEEQEEEKEREDLEILGRRK